jgi:hypothetical protein
MPTTGTSSVSFRVWLATFLPGLGTAVAGFAQNTNGVRSAAMGGIGLAVSLVSTIFKLLHDKGLHIATIQAAGSDIAAQLPQLRADLSKTVSFIEQDVPGVQSLLSSLGSRVGTVEARIIPDAKAIEGIVRSVLTSVLAGVQPAVMAGASVPPAPAVAVPGGPAVPPAA